LRDFWHANRPEEFFRQGGVVDFKHFVASFQVVPGGYPFVLESVVISPFYC
jgi:hypothetical protein